LDGQRILRTDIDISLVRADGVASDRHSFEYRVGVAFERGTIHVGAGVTFVSIADHVLLACGLHGGELPLLACGEACATASAEARLQDFSSHLVRFHFKERLFKGLVAVAGYIFVNLIRVDHPAVAQHDTELFLVEMHPVDRDICFAHCCIIEKALNDTALDDMLFDNGFRIFRFDIHIECVLRQNLDNRTLFTETHAPSTHNLYIVHQFMSFHRTLQRAEESDTFVGFTGSTAANQNVMFISHGFFLSTYE